MIQDDKPLKKNNCGDGCEGCDECRDVDDSNPSDTPTAEDIERPVEEALNEAGIKDMLDASRIQRVLPALRKPDGAKIGRNDPCPCGSERKFKKCCWDKVN